MTHQPHSPAAQSTAARSTELATSPDLTRIDGWTRERQVRFLQHLSASHSVAAAARSVGMSRQSAYGLRARLKGEPFDLAWTAAFRSRFDALAEAALDRAMNGVEVPHLHNGEVVHTSRRYDERLTIALLAMRDQFRPPHAPHYTPAAAYGADDLGMLLERVATGPETWAEQQRQEVLAARAALADEEEWDEEGSEERREEEDHFSEPEPESEPGAEESIPGDPAWHESAQADPARSADAPEGPRFSAEISSSENYRMLDKAIGVDRLTDAQVHTALAAMATGDEETGDHPEAGLQGRGVNLPTSQQELEKHEQKWIWRA